MTKRHFYMNHNPLRLALYFVLPALLAVWVIVFGLTFLLDIATWIIFLVTTAIIMAIVSFSLKDREDEEKEKRENPQV